MAQILATTEVKSRYVQGHLLGSGGVGAVYKAWDRRLKRTVALKRIHKKASSPDHDPEVIINRELEILSASVHPRLLLLYDSDEDDKGPFFVTEFIAGKNLMAFMRRRNITERVMIEITLQTLDGLHALHRMGYVHGDLKPDNIMITEDTAEWMVKLIDFGCSRKVGEPQRTDYFMGCCYYAPPELLRGKPFSVSADLYSLGHVIYHAAAGIPACDSDDLRKILKQHVEKTAPSIRDYRPEFTRGFSEWLGRLMDRDSRERFSDAAEARVALTSVYHDLIAPGKRGDEIPTGWILTGGAVGAGIAAAGSYLASSG